MNEWTLKLEASPEQSISNKVAHILDKVVHTIMNRIHKDIGDGDMHESFSQDIKAVNITILTIEWGQYRMIPNRGDQPGVILNVIIRELPEATHESVQ